MFQKAICTLGLFVLLVSFSPNAQSRAVAQENPTNQETAGAQEEPKPLDPKDPRLTFSFPIQPGGKPFRFKVELDKTGIITGISVFRSGDSHALQTLPACGILDTMQQVTDNRGDDQISLLLDHADLNFDGFEDLQLAANANAGRQFYCIYLWDAESGHFLYSKELSNVSENLEVHPENKTLTNFAYWGDAWDESTFRWKDGEIELIEEDSLLGDWSNITHSKCGFTFTCSRLVNGKMVTTLEKPVCTPEEMVMPEDVENLPGCSATATPSAPNVPKSKSATEKKD